MVLFLAFSVTSSVSIGNLSRGVERYALGAEEEPEEPVWAPRTIKLQAFVPSSNPPGEGPVCDPNGVAVFLLVDVSGSMEKSMEAVKEALRAFLTNLQKTDLVALGSFSTMARLDFPFQTLETGESELLAKIDSLSSSGFTNMTGGLWGAEEHFSQNQDQTEGFTRALVLLSDGNPNRGGDPRAVGERLKETGVRVFAIGLGRRVNGFLLLSIASPGDYYFAPAASDLKEIYETISENICER